MKLTHAAPPSPLTSHCGGAGHAVVRAPTPERAGAGHAVARASTPERSRSTGKQEAGAAAHAPSTLIGRLSPRAAVREVEIPITTLLMAITDRENAHEWVARCRTSEVLERPAPGHVIEYHRTDGTRLTADRDVVVELTTEAAEHGSGAELIINIRHTQHAAAPPPPRGCIRIPYLHAQYVLRRVSAQTTLVRYAVTVDPGGPLPKSLMQLFMGGLADQTLDGLTRQAATRHYGAAPGELATALVAATAPHLRDRAAALLA